MNRRSFIGTLASGLLAAPLAAEGQQAGKVPRIGFLSVTSPSDRPLLLDAFRQGLRELGWVEGQNIVIGYRYAEVGSTGCPAWRPSWSGSRWTSSYRGGRKE